MQEGGESVALDGVAVVQDAVGHRVGHSLREVLLEGPLHVFIGGVGTLGYGLEGLPEGGLVEDVGTGGLGGRPSSRHSTRCFTALKLMAPSLMASLTA